MDYNFGKLFSEMITDMLVNINRNTSCPWYFDNAECFDILSYSGSDLSSIWTSLLFLIANLVYRKILRVTYNCGIGRSTSLNFNEKCLSVYRVHHGEEVCFAKKVTFYTPC